MDTATKRKLNAAKKLWKKARTRASESTFGDYEDGRYKAKLVSADLATSNSSGRLQVNWKWKFTTGEYKGKTVMDFDGLETEDNLVWLGRKLVKLGAEMPEDLADLEETLKELVGEHPVANIQLVTSGEFQNLRVQKLATDDDEDEDDIDEDDDDSDVEDEEDEDDSDEEDEDDSDEDEDDSDEDEDEDDSDEDDSDEEDEDEEDADEEDEDEEDGVEVEVGDRVIGKVKGKDKVGTIVSIAKNGQAVKVRLDAGGKVVSVPIEDVSVPEEDTTPKKPAPKSKTTKKKGKSRK